MSKWASGPFVALASFLKRAAGHAVGVVMQERTALVVAPLGAAKELARSIWGIGTDLHLAAVCRIRSSASIWRPFAPGFALAFALRLAFSLGRHGLQAEMGARAEALEAVMLVAVMLVSVLPLLYIRNLII